MLKILKEIYLCPGIHMRAISRKIRLGLPAIKNQIDNLMKENLIYKKQEGRNLKLFVNMKNIDISPYLHQIEYQRLNALPKSIKIATFDFLNSLETKPIVALIFGSYARGDYKKSSDLDLLLVFNDVRKKGIETKARLISSRQNINLQPVYISWSEFKRKFYDIADIFMQEVRKNKIIVSGVEYWVLLENEKA